MRLILVVLLVAAASASPRQKRQTDGGFWWENLGGTVETVAVAPPAELEVEPLEKVTSVDKTSVDSEAVSTHSETEVIEAVQPSYEPCSGQNRVCVPWNLCRNGTIITDGFGLLSLRSGVSVNQHSDCPLYLEVCCQEPEDYDYIYDDIVKDIEAKKPLPLSTCGQRNYDGLGATIGRLTSSQSQFGEFPWMTAVLRFENFTGSVFKLYLCGGSLIRENVVLTAAHCVNEFLAKDVIIRVGEWDTQQTYEQYPHQERHVKKILSHPLYNSATLVHDVALLVLDSPVVAADNVQTICLPRADDVFDFANCFSTGWGKEEFGENGTYQNILKNVGLDVVPLKQCETGLQGTRLGDYFRLHTSFLCAGGLAGVDTCRGDGGSPLVCKKQKGDHHIDGYYQAGIVSWGIGCGEDGVPGVYASVPDAMTWIDSQLTNELA